MTIPDFAERWYHRLRDRLGLTMHNFVRDGQDETDRLRQRLRVHLALLTVNTSFAVLTGYGVITVAATGGITGGVLLVQEIFDSVGKF